MKAVSWLVTALSILFLQELKLKIELEKQRTCHKWANAFVFIIMSHGDEHGNLRSSDEKMLNINDDVLAPFDGENWPIMQGKPDISHSSLSRR